MKRIILTLLFTALSYVFIFYTTGFRGQFINEYLQEIFEYFMFGSIFFNVFGSVIIYIYIGFLYSRKSILGKYERLFFQMYSPWAILGYTIVMLMSMTEPSEDFSLVFTAYSSVFFILVMMTVSVNIVSFRAMLEPKSVFARLNMKIIFIIDILILIIFFITIFIFAFNNTL
ncbi:MAG: hypothetical protein KQ78_00253 [Candidatus Izimaplasma bacterium HR2]|nr:MAG: hypothetical protein KQ78_00253 [Candidatus Izimaplasma bacterium HR2]